MSCRIRVGVQSPSITTSICWWATEERRGGRTWPVREFSSDSGHSRLYFAYESIGIIDTSPTIGRNHRSITDTASALIFWVKLINSPILLVCMAGHTAVQGESDLFGHATSGAVKFVLFAWLPLSVIVVFDLLVRWNLEMAKADFRWFLAWCWPRWFKYEAPLSQSSS